jgi:transcriptional regulator with GAF, ATPase, and Fis domain
MPSTAAIVTPYSRPTVGISRADRNLKPVDCAAVTGELMTRQLFGHLEGAFTGASHASLGCFRAADQGTIFLDEIGEMELSLQSKLLRVLQERVVVPVGGHDGIPVDVRVVAATNRDLEEEVRAGRFREDLFYRLNVVAFPTKGL